MRRHDRDQREEGKLRELAGNAPVSVAPQLAPGCRRAAPVARAQHPRQRAEYEEDRQRSEHGGHHEDQRGYVLVREEDDDERLGDREPEHLERAAQA